SAVDCIGSSVGGSPGVATLMVPPFAGAAWAAPVPRRLAAAAPAARPPRSRRPNLLRRIDALRFADARLAWAALRCDSREFWLSIRNVTVRRGNGIFRFLFDATAL